MSKDYYKTLGIEKSATKEQIKKAYKKLAKKYHPDLNKDDGATEKFKEINEAASVLGDDKKRQHYDQFGTADPSQGFGGGGFDYSNFGGGFSDFGDIFDAFFGGGSRRGGPKRGSDLRYRMDITLEEAAFGATKHIVIPKQDTCSRCKGTGGESSSDIKTCDECGGQGRVRRAQRTPFGIFQTTATCRKCNGSGEIIKNPCPMCDGSGIIGVKKKLEVKIPAGAATNTQLRLSGEGEAGERGAPTGDLYVVLNVLPHDKFERDGNDIYIEVPVSFTTAALGGEIEVPTLKGSAKLKVPTGTQSGTTFRMKGKGIPSLRGFSTGSENVTIYIDVPKKLTKKQKELLQEFEGNSKKKKGFFGL